MIKSKRVKMYVFLVMASIQVIIAFSYIGNIDIDGFSLSFANVPVLIGAMALGPVESTALGLLYGLTSLFKAMSFEATGMDILYSLEKSGNVTGTLVLTVGTRILLGLMAGLIYKYVERKTRDKTRVVTIFASVTILVFTFIFVAVTVIFFPGSRLEDESIVAVICSFVINLAISIICCRLTESWFGRDKTKELFNAVDQNNLFEILNKKLKFYVTSIMSVIVFVVITLVFYEFRGKAMNYIDINNPNRKYFHYASIQLFIAVVLALFTLTIFIRYYAYYALAESERNMRMVNMLPGGVICLDCKGEDVRISFASDGFRELMGYSADEPVDFIGRDPFDFCHPEDIPMIHQHMKVYSIDHPHFELTYRIRNFKKGYIWITLTAYLGQRVDDFTRVYGIVMNVDDQVNRKNELEQKYIEGQMVNDMIANNSLFAFRMNLTRNSCNLENNNMEYPIHWASEIEDIEELFKVYAERNTNMDAMLGFRKMFNKEAMIAAFENGKTSFTFEHNFMLAESDIRWIESRVALMRNPATREIEGFLYATDIDEQKKTKIITQRVLIGEYEYVELINIVDDSLKMYMYQPSTRFGVDLNKLTYSQFISNRMMKMVEEQDVKKVAEKMSIATVVRELEYVHLYSCAFTVFTDEGPRRKLFQYQYFDKFRKNIIFTQSDITDVYVEDQRKADILRNALKSAEEANAARTDFFSRVSHDLRTPLNAVIGLSSIALEEQDVNKLHEYISKISVSGEYLLGLTNDILDMSKIENDKLRLSLISASMTSCMKDVLDIAKPQAEAKNIRFIYSPGSFTDTPVMVDATRLRQVVMNLLSNAIKFTPEGGTIWLSIEQHQTKDSVIVNKITVKDTGVGMTEEFCKTAFEPFSQEFREGVKNQGGTGLGLQIVKKLVTLMDGDISLSSNVGEGTEFVITVGFKESLQDLVEVETTSEVSYDFTGKIFLLAEDNVINTEIVEILLNKVGARVESVDNGLKAVLAMQEPENEDRYDAILMDIQMPVLDGLKATQSIRGINTDYANTIPIIAMTANAFDTDVQNSLEAGMNAHISKPIDPNELYKVLDNQLSKK